MSMSGSYECASDFVRFLYCLMRRSQDWMHELAIFSKEFDGISGAHPSQKWGPACDWSCFASYLLILSFFGCTHQSSASESAVVAHGMVEINLFSLFSIGRVKCHTKT